ncbi:rapid alkalinization factor-like [Curcuma longa]|uniref:rapid alkalinization factor-like n=1 Tax=Curcuma longa TaxID=136217 RepID=UPI003D9E15AE
MALRLITSLPLLFALFLLSNPTPSPAAEATAISVSDWSRGAGDGGLSTCEAGVGECVGDEEEEGEMESDSVRRVLAANRGRYISYDALKRDRVPCDRRGQSYYNCSRQRQANPYRRGCTVITRCARMLH